MSRWAMPLLIGLGLLASFAWASVRALGDARLHLAAFYGLYAAVFAAYLAGLWIVDRLHKEKHRLKTSMLLTIIIGSGMIWRAIMLPAAPVFSDDIYRYQWDGRVQKALVDPYQYAPDAPELAYLRDNNFSKINFPHLRTIYPPLTERAFWFVSCFRDAVFAHKLFFVLMEAVIIWSIIAVLRRRKLSRLWVLAYAWHPLPVVEVAFSGHNDTLGIALTWLGLAALHRQQWANVALWWVGALLSKFMSVILAPWWFFQGMARRWLTAFLVVSAAAMAFHSRVIVNAIDSLSAMTGRRAANTCLYPLIQMVAGQKPSAVVVVVLWALFIFWWAKKQPDPVKYLFGALTVAALISPALHPWYLLWLIPCFCFIRAPAVMALTGTAVLTYTVWPGYLSNGTWQMPWWARLLEFTPVAALGIWSLKQCGWRLSFLQETNKQPWASS